MLRRISQPALLVMFALAVHAADKTFTCADCHKAEAHSSTTLMGQALMQPGTNTVLAAHPKLTWSRGLYSYKVDTTGEQSTYSVSDGTNTIATPIRWGFGARAQTFVIEHEGRLYESLVSFYPKNNGLAVTIGDESIQPKTLLEAFGRPLADREVASCFGCHSQGALTNGQLHLDNVHPGVQCENCHPDAKAHMDALAHGKTNVVPRKLASLTPEETSNFCGQCHRTWDRVVRDRLRGEINVRFQPYRLANSKCYDGADPRLSCTTCHDPHKDAVVDAAFYDAKCQACHDPHTKNIKGKLCPVGTSNCTNCHMPKVPLPGGMQVFTDHQIRIAHAGEPYPN
ncbi:MAG TPA: cytochrome c3 family protein [Bryobacteraceae bacterium]|jgi:Zn finger protein HypA/HybF involved in hydrogenase expression